MKRLYVLLGLLAVFSLSINAIWPSPAHAVPSFVSLGQIKAEGLRVPGAMDLDAAGNLYVADCRGGLVHKFNPYGSLVQSFDLQTTGRGVAVTPDGKRLFASRDQAVVVVDVVTGELLGELSGAEISGPEFAQAGEIDLDAAGNVFVVDAGKMLVKIYGPSGQYLTQFGGIGKENGRFMRIGGMAINPAGQLVVADASALNGKIQVFTLGSDMAVVQVVSYLKSSAANFGSPYMYSPRGLAFDDQGRGYFLEFLRSQIRVTNANFGYLGAYTQTGEDVGQLLNVYDTIFDDVNDRLFVSCDNARIEILGVDGGQNPVHLNHPPTVPKLLSPVGGSEVDTAVPVLEFSNALDEDGDALTYRVVVKHDSEVVFDTSVPAASSETTSVQLSGVVLQENAPYAWSVQAFDAETSSDVSEEASFVVNAVDEAPSVPELVSPVSGEPVDGFDSLTWGEALDPDPNDTAISYTVEVASDDTFTDVLASKITSETAIVLSSFEGYPTLTDGDQYAWRVVAVDQDQLASEPSVAGRFVYDTTVLQIRANIPGAEVFLGGNHAFPGRKVGTAPLELRDVSVGTTSVVVTRAGFEPYVAQVVIDDRENVNHAAILVPAMQDNGLQERVKGVNGKLGLTVNGAAVPFLVDFENDGQLDMLVGDSTGQVQVFKLLEVGNNYVEFSSGTPLDLPVLPGVVPFVADWDNDGRKDLLAGLADGTVQLFLNTGEETAPAFGLGEEIVAAGGTMTVGSSAAPAVVDFNGDNRKDLLVGNGAGQVVVYLNQGTDEVPQLGAAQPVVQVEGAVVPFSVDWDADGAQELLLTAAGDVRVFRKTDEGYVPFRTIADSGLNAAFPVDLNGGKGKEMLAGRQGGELVLFSGNSDVFVASYQAALLEKIDELAGLVADEMPEALDDVTGIRLLAEAGEYALLTGAADALADKLVSGPARVSALELADLGQ